MEKYEVLEPDYFYHIFNRGNNKENLFFEEENYSYFLKLFEKHILPVANLYAYCLLKNHFHLVLKIKSDNELEKLEPGKEKLSQPFSNFFNAYTKAINKKYNREGSLFRVRFKRQRITDESYLRNVIAYVHLNPVKHSFTEKFESFPYSSFQYLFLDSSIVKKKEVLEIFGGIENLKYIHNEILKNGNYGGLE